MVTHRQQSQRVKAKILIWLNRTYFSVKGKLKLALTDLMNLYFSVSQRLSTGVGSQAAESFSKDRF